MYPVDVIKKDKRGHEDSCHLWRKITPLYYHNSVWKASLTYGWRSHSSFIATSLACASLRLNFSVEISFFKAKYTLDRKCPFVSPGLSRSLILTEVTQLLADTACQDRRVGEVIWGGWYAQFFLWFFTSSYLHMQISYLLLASWGTGFLQNSMCIDHSFFLQCFAMGAHFKIFWNFFFAVFPWHLAVFLFLPLISQNWMPSTHLYQSCLNQSVLKVFQ